LIALISFLAKGVRPRTRIIAITIFIIVVITLYFRRKRRREIIENVIISIIRSRNGATLDDIIIGAHISSKEASKYIQELIARNVIKVQEKDGKTVYTSA